MYSGVLINAKGLALWGKKSSDLYHLLIPMV